MDASMAGSKISAARGWIVFTLLLVCFAAQLFVGGAGRLLSRQLWMDEIHSIELIEDADWQHANLALQDGADYNPPGYYIIARAFSRLTGSPDTTRLRLLSLCCVFVGIGGIVWSLRRDFSAMAIAFGVLTLCAQRIVIDQAFEIRFYSVWFAGIVWFSVLFDDAGRQKHFGIGRSLLTGLLAVVVTSVHYFGIMSVWLVGGIYFLSEKRFRRQVGFWIPCLSSLATLIACLPYYQGQRAALTVATWVSAPTLDHARRFFGALTPWYVILIAALVGGICRAQKPTEPRLSFVQFLSRHRALVGLTGMLPVLVIFSFAVQPALVARYAFVATAGFVPVIAWLMNACGRRLLIVCCVLCVALGSQRAGQLNDDLRRIDSARIELLDAIDKHCDGRSVVFLDRIDHFPMQRLAGAQRTANWYLLDFETQAISDPTALRIVQRDVARRFVKWYPDYQTIPLNELTNHDSFLVVSKRDKLITGDEFAGYEQTPIAEQLFELQRKPASIPQGRLSQRP